EFLEDQDAIGPRSIHWHAIHQNFPGGLWMQPRDQVQQRGLAASRRTDDAKKLSRLHFKIDFVEREQALPRSRLIAERDCVQRDFRDNHLGDRIGGKRDYRGSRFSVKHIRTHSGARTNRDWRGIRILRTRAHWMTFIGWPSSLFPLTPGSRAKDRTDSTDPASDAQENRRQMLTWQHSSVTRAAGHKSPACAHTLHSARRQAAPSPSLSRSAG